MKRYLVIFVALLVLSISCENITDLISGHEDTEKEDTTVGEKTEDTEKDDTTTDDKTDDTTSPKLPPTALGTTFNLNNLTLKSPNGDITLTGFDGTIYINSSCTIEAGNISDGIINLTLPALNSDQLWSTQNATEGLVFTPDTGEHYNAWLYVKQTGSDILYRLNGLSDQDSWAKFIYSDTDTLLTGSFTDSRYSYTYNCDLKVGWNWCDWSWPGDQRICATKKYDNYTWNLSFEYAPDNPGIAMDAFTVTLNSVPGDGFPAEFNGTIYLNKSCTIQAGSIENGVIRIALPGLSTSQLDRALLSRAGLIFEPNTGGYYNSWLYVKEEGGEEVYELDGFSVNNSSVKFIYSDTETKYSGSFIGSDSWTYTYNCDLEVGWNWCDWTWPEEDERCCTSTNNRQDYYTHWRIQ